MPDKILAVHGCYGVRQQSRSSKRRDAAMVSRLSYVLVHGFVLFGIPVQ
jgi:hypothetical protein